MRYHDVLLHLQLSDDFIYLFQGENGRDGPEGAKGPSGPPVSLFVDMARRIPNRPIRLWYIDLTANSIKY